jgi:hypothetical protein
LMGLRDRLGHLESPLLAKQALRAFRVQLEIRDHLVGVRQALREPPGLRGRLGLQVLQVQQGQVEPLVILALPGSRGRQVPADLLGAMVQRGLRENKGRQALLVWLVRQVRQERQARQVNWEKLGQQEQERQVQLELQARPGHKAMKELQVRLDLLEYKEPQVKRVLRELRVQPDQRGLRATLVTMALRDRREIKALREQLAQQA